jgi:23S rRNA (pseudouridine1915-N3)-methyltransferase
MNIEFYLHWLDHRSFSAKAFKSQPSGDLFLDYMGRLSKFTSCKVHGSAQGQKEGQLWVCDRSSGRVLSSEELAAKIEKLQDSGVRTLGVVIGGPDGLSPSVVKVFKPEFVWSFGAMTLPHELAAVVASEQIYRAWTIMKNLPYHVGH